MSKLFVLCQVTVVLWTALVAPLARAQAAPPAPVPIEAFFKPASMSAAALSPSGRWLAALSNEGQRRVGIVMIDLDGKEGSQFIEASEKDDVEWFAWVNDDWLVFRVDDPNDRSARGMGAGLMATSRDGKRSRMLVARRWDTGDPIRRRRALEPNHSYVGLGAPGSTEIVLEERHYDVHWEYAHSTLKVIDVASGALRTMLSDAPRAYRWWLDGSGRARVAAQKNGDQTSLFWSDARTGQWRELGSAPSFDMPFWPQYVDGENGLIVNTTDAQGHMALRRFDFTTMKPEAQPLLSTPGFDGPVTPIVERGSNTTLGLHLWVDTRTTAWFTPGLRDLQTKVDEKMPGRVNVLSCQPCDKPKAVLIHSYTDIDPGIFVLHRPADDKWQLLGRVRPEIEPETMARLEFHRTRARDGLDLPVWVTRPPALAKAGKAGPAVVLVHGGPWVRGVNWAWHAEAQFLASRGYVVIEPEFRGSAGYSLKHFRAGYRQWGQTMQDDVTDGLRFAVAQGWVDASRVCIMGASYGGYSALVGLMKDPDQYRCGVALAAVSDPRFMFDFHWSDISTDGKQFSLPTMLGDRKADDAMFAANSPLEHADRIKAPVLLVHGGADRRVPIQNGERMRDALRKNRKDVQWVYYADEGHGFQYLANELDYYRKVEAFLAKHLK